MGVHTVWQSLIETRRVILEESGGVEFTAVSCNFDRGEIRAAAAQAAHKSRNSEVERLRYRLTLSAPCTHVQI